MNQEFVVSKCDPPFLLAMGLYPTGIHTLLAFRKKLIDYFG